MPLFLKPNPDNILDGEPVKVWDPQHRDFLPAHGRTVQRTPYWQRRIAEGSALIADPAAEEAPLKPDDDPGSDTDKIPGGDQVPPESATEKPSETEPPPDEPETPPADVPPSDDAKPPEDGNTKPAAAKTKKDKSV